MEGKELLQAVLKRKFRVDLSKKLSHNDIWKICVDDEPQLQKEKGVSGFMKQSIKEIFHVSKKDGGYGLVDCIGRKEHVDLNEILLEFIDKQLVKIDGDVERTTTTTTTTTRRGRDCSGGLSMAQLVERLQRDYPEICDKREDFLSSQLAQFLKQRVIVKGGKLWPVQLVKGSASVQQQMVGLSTNQSKENETSSTSTIATRSHVAFLTKNAVG